MSVNDAPTVDTHNYTTFMNAPLAIAAPGLLAGASDADGDAALFAGSTPPAHGALVVQLNGSFSYTPESDFYGTDRWADIAWVYLLVAHWSGSAQKGVH